MIVSLELENFRSFGERQKIEFAPITLIFGENSAGKSSILHALNLLKQTRESRESAVLLPRAEGGNVDLGSFKNFIYDHDLEKLVSIAIQVDVARSAPSGWFSRSLPKSIMPGSVTLDLNVRKPPRAREIELASLGIGLDCISGTFAGFVPATVSAEAMREFRRYGAMAHQLGRRGSGLRGVKCVHLSDADELWHPFFRRWVENRALVIECLANMLAQPARMRTNLWATEGAQPEGNANLKDAVTEAMAFYSKDFSFEQLKRRLVPAEVGTLLPVDGFLPIPSRGMRESLRVELLAIEYYDRTSGADSSWTPNVASVASGVGRLVDGMLEGLFPLGPFRRPPERLYIFAGSSPQDVGYRGETLPDLLFRRRELLDTANVWLRHLGIDYTLALESVGTEDADLFELRLIDNRRDNNISVAWSDVGFGISQLLPFIVQCIASERKTISIEQPEVHVHPRLQAQLGDLLAASIREPHAHQFIIETHSEHLILRILKLIRTGTLTPSDVSVLYVRRSTEGSRVTRIRVDEHGNFVDDWPGGFFAERLSEFM